MNQERTQAYGRVVKTLDDLGPTKLHGDEQARIRDAADVLIFASDGGDAEVREAVDNVLSLADHLRETGRWSDERAERLVDDVRACGPDALAHAA
jgi:hypothetical protein